jgi:hypothetical protein
MPYLGIGAEIHQLKLDIDWHLAKTKAFPSFAQFLVLRSHYCFQPWVVNFVP